jgi:hypothetical protein
LQREYEGALATFVASYSRPSQQREEQWHNKKWLKLYNKTSLK